MKETIYTIPLNDAFHAEDECPFCRLERDAEPARSGIHTWQTVFLYGG